MPLLQIGSRSPKFVSRIAGQLAALAEESAASAAVTADAAQATAEQAGDLAVAAQVVASDAVDTADAAQVVATAANEKSTRIFTLQQVRDSYSDAGVVSAADAGNGTGTVTIAAHTRHYLEGSVSVAVSAGTIVGVPLNALRFISYNDPTFQGGTVPYAAYATVDQATSSLADPGKHFVASITVPAAGAPPATNPGGGTPWWNPRENQLPDN